MYYEDADGLVVCQYVPTALEWERAGVPVTVSQTFDSEVGDTHGCQRDSVPHRPSRWAIDLAVRCEQPVELALKLRLPWWMSGPAKVLVNGVPEAVSAGPSGEGASILVLPASMLSECQKTYRPTRVLSLPLLPPLITGQKSAPICPRP